MSSPEHPTSAAGSVEDSKRPCRRWFEEVVNGGDLALADERLGPGYGLHVPGMPEPLDREAHKALVMVLRTAFPDWVETVEDVIAEGDKVVIRVTGRGTQEAEFQRIPPTGARVTATGVYGALGLMRPLGAIPASEPPPNG